MHIQFSLGTKFQIWIYNFDFLDQIYPKRVLVVEIGNSEHHDWILDIRISLGTKFRQIWCFEPNLPKKGIIWAKTAKLNTIIEFLLFKLV